MRRGRKDAEKRLGAREIVRRVSWLDDPLVYWSGIEPDWPDLDPLVFLPVTRIIGHRLKAQAAGLFAVRLGQSTNVPKSDASLEELGRFVNPTVTTVKRITGKTIANTAYALKVADRYPKALPRLVNDVKRWRSAAEHRLRRVGEALSGSRAMAETAVPPQALVIEEVAVWLGPDDARPSERLRPATVSRWLRAQADATALGARCASVLLGRVRWKAAGWPICSASYELGHLLSRWPVDVLCQSACAGLSARALRPVLSRFRKINGRAAASAAQELVCAGETGRDLSGFLHDLPTLFRAIGTPYDDPAGIARSWGCAVVGLAGRLLACTGDACRVGHLAAWLDTCRANCSSGADGCDALRLWLVSLSAAVGVSGHSSSNLARCVEVLGTFGGTVLRVLAGEDKATPPGLSYWRQRLLKGAGFWGAESQGCLWVLGRLGALSLEQCGALVPDFARLSAADDILARRPGALADFATWLLRHPVAREDVDGWCALFSCSYPDLTKRVTRWADSLVARGNFKWGEITSFVDDISSFCLDDWPSAQAESRVRFLMRSIWLCDALADAVLNYKREILGSAVARRGNWDDVEGAFFERSDLLRVAFFWDLEGFDGLSKVVESLLRDCADRDRAELDKERRDAGDYFQCGAGLYFLAAAFSGGELRRLLGFLHTRLESRLQQPDPSLNGWHRLGAHPGVRAFLAECAARTEWIEPVLKLLRRLALAGRLEQGSAWLRALAAWEKPVVRTPPALPETPSRLRQRLRELQVYRTLAGHGEAIPEPILNALDWRGRAEREVAHLTDSARKGALAASRQARLRRLSSALSDPAAAAAEIEKAFDKVYPKQLQLAKLAALEAAVRSVIRGHWRRVMPDVAVDFDDPDWDNALLLYSTIKKNRRILKGLLRHDPAGTVGWVRAHPTNRAFLDALRAKGVDAELWTGPFAQAFETQGNTWTVHAETNPLKVLQMGNLFGTCLSAEDANAFATVANAVEINKRVLYLRDHHDRILGRKLIVLHEDATLFGFRSYGSGASWATDAHQPWVKIFFDLFCLEIVRQCRARLAERRDQENLRQKAEKSLALFAKWYFDGFESFDWWVLALADDAKLSEREIAKRCAALLKVQARKNDEDSVSVRKQLLRSILWLGEFAAPVLGEANGLACAEDLRDPLEEWQRKGIVKYANSQRVRALARAGLPAKET